MTWYRRTYVTVCAYHLHLSLPQNVSTHKPDRKWQTHLCHAPNTGTSRGLLGWHETSLSAAVTRGTLMAVPSSIHPAPNPCPCRQFINGDFQPNRLFPGIQRKPPGKLRSKYIHPRSSLHFLSPLFMGNLESFTDMAAALSRRRRHEGSHRYHHPESSIPGRGTRDVVLVGSRRCSRH